LDTSQNKDGINGNPLNPTDRSELPPNSSIHYPFVTTAQSLLLSHPHTERPAPKQGATRNYDAFYQFFELRG
jgi:hypothetical protein